MMVQTQLEEMEEVVQVYLPVELRVDGQRQIDSGQLPGDSHVEKLVVGVEGAPGVVRKHGADLLRRGGVDRFLLPSLLVVLALKRNRALIGKVDLILHDRVAT